MGGSRVLTCTTPPVIEGTKETMIRTSLMLVVLALGASACSSQLAPTPTPIPTTEASTGPESPAPTLDGQPVSATQSDALFTVTVSIPNAQVTTTTAIEPVARFGYIGPLASVDVNHGAPLVYWSIRELGGQRMMIGGVDTVCLQSTLVAGQIAKQEFAKSGEISEDPRTGFDLAWFRQPQLRLPAGHWSIIATFDGYLGACGGERHQVSPAVEVEVVK